MVLRSRNGTQPDNRGVSPVVGVILMVAVVVILAAVLGEFVFGISSTLGGSDPSAGVSVEETKAGFVVQLTDKQNAEEVRVETNEGDMYTLSEVGDSVTVNTRNPGRFTVIGVNDGEEAVLLSRDTGGGWEYATGDGSEGSLTVTGTQIVNDYAHLTTDATAGGTSIEVSDGSAFSEGDEVLIIQMQDSNNGAAAGTYEFRAVASVSGNTLSLESALQHSFGTGEYTKRTEPIPMSNPGTVTQVVRVPQYTDVTIDGGTITAPDWNGRTGGIVAFRAAGTVEFANGGEVNVTGAGFRGGTCGSCGDDWDGGRGEGVNGWHYGGGERTYSDEVSENNMNGGGGNHVDDNDGGDPASGGGHATAGGTVPDQQSSYDSIGGIAIGDASLSRMYFGGGGGAGGDNDKGTPLPENSHGGGIALITAEEIVDARVYADGIDGKGDEGYCCHGPSGGGAGGTISLSASSVTMADVTADGGASADNKNRNEESGVGGDGYIKIVG